MKKPVLMTLTTTTMTVIQFNSYDDWNDQDLDDVPRLQEVLTRLMAGHIQAEAGEGFFC